MTDAIEESNMTVEDEQGNEGTAEPGSDVEPESATDAADDDVEAHVWRAQS